MVDILGISITLEPDLGKGKTKKKERLSCRAGWWTWRVIISSFKLSWA